MRYYLYIDEKVDGPYDLDQIKSMDLPTSTQVCPEGSTDWLPLSTALGSSTGQAQQLSAEDYLAQAMDQAEQELPESIGNYKVIKELGRGGMSIVYLAEDKSSGQEIAIKELKIDEQTRKDPEALESLKKRFKRECEILLRINHKNIVSIHEVIQDNNNQYMVMEYLKGKDLEDTINESNKLPVKQCVKIISSMCLALDYIHNKNMIHRDIKPANIVMLENGDVKLADFGVTRDLNAMTMTRDGSLVGTIAYASPEQDSRELDGRSDIFSLGVVLYEIVTGERPFKGDTIASVLLKIATKDPKLPSEIDKSIHKMLEDIIMKSIAKEPEDRFTSAHDMHEALEEYRVALESNDLSILQRPLDGVQNRNAPANSNLKRISSNNLIKQAPIPKPAPIANQNFKKLPVNLVKKPLPVANKNNIGNPNQKKLMSNNLVKKTLEPKVQNSNLPNKEEKIEIQKDFNLDNKIDDVLEKTTEVDKQITEPLKKEPEKKEKKKYSSYESKKKKNKLKNNLIAVSFPIIFIALLILGIFNGFDLTISLGIFLITYFDHKNKQSNAIPFIVMISFIIVSFFWFKSFVPNIEAENSSKIYLLIDLAMLLISFIASLFLTRFLDSFSDNKKVMVNIFGGIAKSLIIILSLIIIVNSTNIISEDKVQKSINESQIANIIDIILPIKLGEKSTFSVDKYGINLNTGG